MHHVAHVLSSSPQSPETQEIAGVKFQVEARPAPGQPFHFAFPVHDLDAARSFWGGVMGCTEGRCAPGKWIDFSLYGHQIVCHWVGTDYRATEYFNPVDGDEVCACVCACAFERECREGEKEPLGRH